jgi:3-oxoacyl-[acyl-carrier protein] reductase
MKLSLTHEPARSPKAAPTRAPRTALIVDLACRGAPAIAHRLAREGYALVLGHAPACTDAARTVSAITFAGGCARAVPVEGSGEAEISRLLDLAARIFGGVDVFINNAREPVGGEADPADTVFDRYFGACHRGMLHGLNAAAPRLAAGSRIVNLPAAADEASVTDSAAYLTPTAALARLTGRFAEALAPRGLIVNAIAASAHCDEAAIAEAVAMLVGADADGCNGELFDVDALIPRDAGVSA